MRASLGAGRARIVCQLLVERFVLTVLALGVGLASAAFGGQWIAGLFVEQAVVVGSSVLSPAALIFSLSVSVLAWLVLNGVPIAHFLRTQRSGLNVAPDSGKRMQRGLVALQSALATLLLVSATLLEGSAVGQMIATDPHAWDLWAPVVGVVPDVRSGDITGPIGPVFYVSLAESPSRDVTLVVRASGSSAAMIPSIRRAVREVDELVPIRAISEMNDVVRAAYATSWVMMGLLIVLAVLATGLGAIGIYAVLAHHVALNKREIGVRMALGAQPGVVVGGIVRSGVLLAGVGIVLGSVAAVASTRYLDSLLFEVSALAPWAFIAPAVALAAASALAAWIPAARAGRLAPAEVLRGD